MSKLLRKNPDVIWKEVDGEIVLLNPKTGDCFGLQAVGTSFWELVDGTRKLDEIVQCLLGEYKVEKTILTDDINELLAIMTEKELVFKE